MGTQPTAAAKLSTQKILVTGARGFLGSHLCLRLCQNGCEVHALSRKKYPSNDNGPRWWQGDLADSARARELLLAIKPDVIFHLSGLVTASPDLSLVLPTFHSLLISTVNLLMAATEIGCSRFVLVASLTEPEPSDADPIPTSPYSAAKWASGAYGRMFHKLYGTPVIGVRPFMTYGPRQDIRKIIPHVILSLLRGERPKLSTGQQLFDWIYIDDVIEGLVAAAHATAMEVHTIDLGLGALVSVREVVHKLTKLIGSTVEPQFGALPDRPLEQVRVADTAYAYAKLGWKPNTSLEEGLKRTVEWYREQAAEVYTTC